MSKIILTRGLSSAGMIRRQITLENQYDVRVAGCRDDFSHGPLLPITDMGVFAAARARFWRSCGYITTARKWAREFSDINALVQNADSIEIWVDLGVQEQIFLLTCIQLLIHQNIDLDIVKIVDFSNVERRPAFDAFLEKTLSNRPKATTLSTQETARFNKAWSALTAPSSEKLATLANIGTGSTTLDNAIEAFLLRYPNTASGLGSIATKILQNASSDWTKSARIVGPAMSWDRMDLVGDLVLFACMKRLASPSQTSPCIEMRGDIKQMWSCEARITKFWSGLP